MNECDFSHWLCYESARLASQEEQDYQNALIIHGRLVEYLGHKVAKMILHTQYKLTEEYQYLGGVYRGHS